MRTYAMRSRFARLAAMATVVAIVGGFVATGFATPAGASHRLASPARVRMGGTLVIDNESGGLWTNNFNPFNPSVSFTSIGIVYEPLVYINVLNGKQTPWLATTWAWGNGNRKLVFNLRHNVTWSDGKPFTAADVAFTFNLMRRFPATDLQSVWTVLKSVTAQGPYRVVMTFKTGAVPYFYYIADQDGIVARHIWAKVKKPDTYADVHPVGTGPFLVSSGSTPQTIKYVRNPRYWQTGKPYISTVLYPAFTSNPPANLMLAEGKADWGGQFIPNIDNYFIRRNPSNFHYWFPPTAMVDIYINLKLKPLDNKLVRQAMAYAVDRQRVSLIGEYGYEPPANQSDIILPNFANWYDQAAAGRYNYTFNPSKAISLLQKAGFKRNGTYFSDKSGKRLSFSIINIGGNTDWVSSVGVIRDNFKQAGIELKIQNLSSNDYDTRLYNGRYDLAYASGSNPAPNPYYDLRALLYSGNSAPIGKAATSNFERWYDPTTDRLLNQFSATTSVARQHTIVRQLQSIMLENVPFIPVTEGVSWYQYNTMRFVGWPTKQNAYVDPAPYDYPDWEIVLMTVHLK